jgi:hypothetical protein
LSNVRDRDIERGSWREEAQSLRSALASERAARQRAEEERDGWKRECDTAVEFHRYALETTAECLPDGVPDEQPNRWLAIRDAFRTLTAERDDARQYVAEVAQGASHYPHDEGDVCVRCDNDRLRAAIRAHRDWLDHAVENEPDQDPDETLWRAAGLDVAFAPVLDGATVCPGCRCAGRKEQP